LSIDPFNQLFSTKVKITPAQFLSREKKDATKLETKKLIHILLLPGQISLNSSS